MNTNSINVYFTELKNLNKNCIKVLRIVKDNPNFTSEQIMDEYPTQKTNKVNPRLSDLFNKGLVKTGNGINKAGHKVNTYQIVEVNEYVEKIDNNLRLILDKLSKLNQDDLRSLSHTVEGMIKYDV